MPDQHDLPPNAAAPLTADELIGFPGAPTSSAMALANGTIGPPIAEHGAAPLPDDALAVAEAVGLHPERSMTRADITGGSPISGNSGFDTAPPPHNTHNTEDSNKKLSPFKRSVLALGGVSVAALVALAVAHSPGDATEKSNESHAPQRAPQFQSHIPGTP